MVHGIVTVLESADSFAGWQPSQFDSILEARVNTVTYSATSRSQALNKLRFERVSTRASKMLSIMTFPNRLPAGKAANWLQNRNDA